MQVHFKTHNLAQITWIGAVTASSAVVGCALNFGPDERHVGALTRAPASSRLVQAAGRPTAPPMRRLATPTPPVPRRPPQPIQTPPVASTPSPTPSQLPGTVYISPGTFAMGSTREVAQWHQNEPLHSVTLTRGFWIQNKEITQQQWAFLMGNNPSIHQSDPNRPVEMVSWYDAIAYANKLSIAEGITPAYDLTCTGNAGSGNLRCSVRYIGADIYSTAGWHLPTEAEWEYAYRAGTTSAWHFGDESSQISKFAWWGWQNGSFTKPVGTKSPNLWGIFDVAGNVAEWCHDNYESQPNGSLDPSGPSSSAWKVVRGGSWASNFADECRAAVRVWSTPDHRNSTLGFRLVRSRL